MHTFSFVSIQIKHLKIVYGHQNTKPDLTYTLCLRSDCILPGHSILSQNGSAEKEERPSERHGSGKWISPPSNHGP